MDDAVHDLRKRLDDANVIATDNDGGRVSLRECIRNRSPKSVDSFAKEHRVSLLCFLM